ncbi:2-phosphosulfolactate phosphatase [Corynebacterium sp. CCM 9185]|uniref:Probable 2-phosphosulfolactate phosphatase n=1 Tax=Corynebacterium marambiense TaxID=2765364 RepID=A0ABS0VXY2_9CORY|nr:2-phosphosulfolactate phosphatase [Corynebacterium marambiense]MBI9001599.1 2-phosphosulfolactate phosphatase [Corynebacterium marambiense]MCK7662063.1 2-phosphosulfolactate phosphatase [Corynebacterium marambiense]
MSDYFGQADYAIRMDWGPEGARRCAADVNIIVDVLSFSTSVTVAAGRGMTVYPCRWKDDRAADFAAEHDAVLAVGRLEAGTAPGTHGISLSPAGLLTATRVPRIVLPSPNGSTISAILADTGAMVVAGCLRNATAVGRWAAQQVDVGKSVAVIAAGERWREDGSLRPALEDHLGAGAILSALIMPRNIRVCSPEALASAGLFAGSQEYLSALLADCVGGRELAAMGFREDVTVAADLDASGVVPMLTDGAFSSLRIV